MLSSRLCEQDVEGEGNTKEDKEEWAEPPEALSQDR